MVNKTQAQSMVERVAAGTSPAQALDEASWSMSKKEVKAIIAKVKQLKGKIEPIVDKGQIVVMFKTETGLHDFQSWVSKQYGYTGKWAMDDLGDPGQPPYKFGVLMNG